jgi:hypothetical protein
MDALSLATKQWLMDHIEVWKLGSRDEQEALGILARTLLPQMNPTDRAACEAALSDARQNLKRAAR